MTDQEIKDYFAPRMNHIKKGSEQTTQPKEKTPRVFIMIKYLFFSAIAFVVLIIGLGLLGSQEPESTATSEIVMPAELYSPADAPISTTENLSYSGTCIARTKKGKGCKNLAEKGSSFCWRH